MGTSHYPQTQPSDDPESQVVIGPRSKTTFGVVASILTAGGTVMWFLIQFNAQLSVMGAQFNTNMSWVKEQLAAIASHYGEIDTLRSKLVEVRSELDKLKEFGSEGARRNFEESSRKTSELDFRVKSLEEHGSPALRFEFERVKGDVDKVRSRLEMHEALEKSRGLIPSGHDPKGD